MGIMIPKANPHPGPLPKGEGENRLAVAAGDPGGYRFPVLIVL